MNKTIGKESFSIGNYTIECEMLQTRSGTRENATFYKAGVELSTGTDFWSNRPWYPFTYANAIRDALSNSGEFDDAEVKVIMDKLAKRDHEALNERFGIIGAIAKMGEVIADTQEEKNDWKKRMLKAGLPGLSIPEDWDELSEEEKTRRLDNVIAHMQGVKQ